MQALDSRQFNRTIVLVYKNNHFMHGPSMRQIMDMNSNHGTNVSPDKILIFELQMAAEHSFCSATAVYNIQLKIK